MMKSLRLAALLILLPMIVLGQNYPKKEMMNYEFMRKHLGNRESGADIYKTPLSLENTLETVTQLPPDSGSIAPDKLATTTKPELFGYSLFARGGTTIEIPQNLALPDNYQLGPGDNIILNLWGRVELEYDLTIDRQGVIFIPKAGEVTLWGLTLAQARERITKKFQSIYSDFKLALSLGRLRSIQVYLFGEVKYPGCYSVNSLATMFSALYLAGGPTTRGSLRCVKLLRTGTETKVVDLYEFLLFGENTAALSLQGGDVIFVEVVGKRVEVSGAVKRPAVYEIRGGETINDIITLAGGVLPSAYLEKVRIDRIRGDDAYEVIDLNLADEGATDRSFAVEDGDRIYLESIHDLTENVIYLEGEFRHTGPYQYRPEMMISQLLAEAGELTLDALHDRIDVLRRDEQGEFSLLTVNPENVLAGGDDLMLQPHDRLIAYLREEVLPKRKVSIFGLVEGPGEYTFYNGMRISDLVFMAGNLRRSAYELRVELARIDEEGRNQLIYASLTDPKEDISLQERDRVFIREIPGWQEEEIVTIDGAVRFPGKYVITNQMNTLASLIERAGGPTEDAFVEGTIFTRSSIVTDLKRRGVEQIINRAAEKRYDSTGQIVIDSSAMVQENSMSNRIVVHVDKILTKGHNGHDLTLTGGDHVYIPEKPAGIQVLGAVPSVSTIAYQSGKKVSYYVKRAGGLLKNADKEHINLIRANGTVLSGRSARAKKVSLGDAIFVPIKVHKERDWLKAVTASVSIITSIAATYFMIDRL
ncbi:MAG: SLBB domain-containing protein [candidate division Zixibacteria bacterium]|nr:SLBB domain-containing protein [candidate division Zixibacteria bacterium]